MLPTNINGDPEYASIVLTLHRGGPALSINAHASLAGEKSTQTPEEAVAALMSAHGESGLLSTASNLRLLADSSRLDVLYVYQPASAPGTAHVVIGSGGYRDLIDAPEFGRGSNFLADLKLLEEIAAEEAADGQKLLRMMRVEDLLEEALEPA